MHLFHRAVQHCGCRRTDAGTHLSFQTIEHVLARAANLEAQGVIRDLCRDGCKPDLEVKGVHHRGKGVENFVPTLGHEASIYPFKPGRLLWARASRSYTTRVTKSCTGQEWGSTMPVPRGQKSLRHTGVLQKEQFLQVRHLGKGIEEHGVGCTAA